MALFSPIECAYDVPERSFWEGIAAWSHLEEEHLLLDVGGQ
jgi:hypothetical protein